MSGARRLLLVGMGRFAEESGGLNRYVDELSTSLEQLGNQVQVVVVSREREPAVLAPYQTIPGRFGVAGRFVGVFRALHEDSKRTEWDCLDLHFALYSSVLWAVPGLRSKPKVVHFHGPWADENRVEQRGHPLSHFLRRGLEAFVYQRADTVVTLSVAFKKIVTERYGVSPAKVAVVRPGINLDRFHPMDRTAARQQLGVPADAFVALSVRRLALRMGLEVLLRAWNEIAGDSRLYVVGTGEQGSQLEDLVTRLGLEQRVTFLGKVPDEDLPTWYAAADVSVVPSLALEGFGLVVLESLACGTPVIASSTGGMAELVPELDPALLVPPGDASALAAKLSDFIEGRHRFPTGEECRLFAEKYRWDEVARKTVAIYDGAGATPLQRPARVVVLAHSARLSGGELALLRLLSGMTDAEPHVILGEHGPLEELLQADGVSFEVLPLAARAHASRAAVGWAAPLLTAVYALRLGRRLRQLRPDLVHANSIKSALYGVVAARIARLPLVWHVRDRFSADYLPPWSAALLRAAVRWLPDAVITNSEATRDALRLRDGADVTVLPSPLRAAPVPSHDVHAERPGPLTVTVLGRLAHWKGQHVALQAFAQAFPFGPERLRLVGDALFGEDEYRDGLRWLAEQLGISQRVEFLGHRRDVDALLADSDILVHSSVIPEPFGNVVLEGMSAGLAVIATDAGGPREVVTHNVDGLLTRPGDVTELADALRLLAANAELRQQLGQEAKETALRYRAEVVAPVAERAYRRVLHRRSVTNTHRQRNTQPCAE